MEIGNGMRDDILRSWESWIFKDKQLSLDYNPRLCWVFYRRGGKRYYSIGDRALDALIWPVLTKKPAQWPGLIWLLPVINFGFQVTAL